MGNSKKISATSIFEQSQILTLETAKKLIGKKIACTNPEYKGNTPAVQEFVLTGIISEWEDAALRPCDDKYSNFQDYWKTFFSKERLEKSKKTFLLQSKNRTHYKCELNNGYFSEPTFFGSDADREVYYLVVGFSDEQRTVNTKSEAISGAREELAKYFRLSKYEGGRINEIPAGICEATDFLPAIQLIDGGKNGINTTWRYLNEN
jgi:hypothetical protein